MEGLDVIKILMSVINLNAALVGVAAVQAVSFLAPPKPDEGPFSTSGILARFVPFVAPLVAAVTTVILEWDGSFAPTDAVRGILSGWASEFLLRIYYKSIKGL